MSDLNLRAVTNDLVALEAVVRALARSHARRSRSALTELLEALALETDRLRTCALPGDTDALGPCSVLDSWIEDLKNEAMDFHQAIPGRTA